MTPFQPEEFYKLAVRIALREPEEAGLRTAIGRSYYACHLVGAEALSRKGWFQSKKGGTDHSALWRALRDHSQPWYLKLQLLYELREHADYHTGAPGQTRQDCHLCTQAGGPSVDKIAWEHAQRLAEDLLPRLRALAPG